MINLLKRKRSELPRKQFEGYTKLIKNRSIEKWETPEKQIKLKEAKRGEKLSAKEKFDIRRRPFLLPNYTDAGTASANAYKFEKVLSLISKKNVTVNEIGIGCNDFRDQTFEPFFFANRLDMRKKEYDINAYSMDSEDIKKIKKQRDIILDSKIQNNHINAAMSELRNKKYLLVGDQFYFKIPKKILKKIKFGQLDLITETPARQADITTMFGVPALGQRLMIKPNEDYMVLLKNAVDSTKTNGYIMCNEISPFHDKQICQRFGLKKIDDGIYQKLKRKK